MKISSLENLADGKSLLPMMGKLTKEINALMVSKFREQGIDLSKEHAIVLVKLFEQDGRPQNDLALVTSRDKTSLTRLLKTMESRALIRRKQCEHDKRVNRVFITEIGRQVLSEAEPILLKLINQSVNDISDSEIEMAQILIKKIYANLNIQYEE